MGLSIKTPAVGVGAGFVQYGQGGYSDAYIRTFWCKKFGCFEICCIRTDKREGG